MCNRSMHLPVALLCKCKKWKEWISMVVVKGLWKSSASLTIITKKIHIPYARSQQGPQTRTLRTLLAPESNGMLSTSDTANGKTTAVLSVDIHRNPHDECILLIKWFSNQMGIWFFSRIALHKTLDMPLQQGVPNGIQSCHIWRGKSDLWDKLMRCWWTVCLSKIDLANICEVNPPRQSWSGLASNWSNSGHFWPNKNQMYLGTSWYILVSCVTFWFFKGHFRR